ncbi:hypothetical protein F5890DRAFT_1599598 [Lentinula detonsa]|uniref:HIT-type domain-containing protein n=1 Tax=Lentinula detonsa TaxID=2804962 RepID=A0AA38PXA4_9AGAR|nr:hypothetical protein F5890DRAFT_1599598 [Lentinula detonsa]
MPSSFQEDSNVVCKICRRQISRYTCPECNIPYCSSTCFKSPAHANCSESFYKKQIESDVRSDSKSKSAEERLKMMEILKRFEEDNLEQAVGDDKEDEDEDEDDLEKRFAGIDIASTSPNTLWSLLSQSERDEFVRSLQDPSSNLSQELLLSEELQRELVPRPWWESASEDIPVHSDALIRNAGQSGNDIFYENTYLPELIDIPSTMVKPLPSGPPLIYNLCAICIAYAFVTRRLATSPLAPINANSQSFQDIEEAKRLLAHLVPFLMDRKSTVLHTTVSAAIDDIWSRLDKSTISSSTFAVLMRDTATLLRPLPVSLISSTSGSSTSTTDIASHPNRTTIYVLSDLSRIFTIHLHGMTRNLHPHIAHKIIFYAAHVLSTPPIVLRSLADDLAARARDSVEAMQFSSGVTGKAETMDTISNLHSTDSESKLIQEI